MKGILTYIKGGEEYKFVISSMEDLCEFNVLLKLLALENCIYNYIVFIGDDIIKKIQYRSDFCIDVVSDNGINKIIYKENDEQRTISARTD